MINIILYDNNSLEKSSVHVLVNILVGCLTNDFNWLSLYASLFISRLSVPIVPESFFKVRFVGFDTSKEVFATCYASLL